MTAATKTLLGPLDRWWFAPAPAERLAMLRILVGGFALGYTIVRLPYLGSYASFDPIHFEPIGVVSLADRPLLPAVVWTLCVLTIVAGCFFVAGWRHRYTGPIFAALLLWVLTYSNSFGKILHTENAMMLHVIILAISPSADALSLDARRRGSVPDPHGRYAWAIRLICLLTVLVYLLAGIAKLKNSGTDFIEGDTLRNYVAFDNVRKLELGSVHSPLGAALLPFPELFTVLAWMSMVLELGAPVALAHRRVGTAWTILVWGFHLGVLALMAIAFVYQLTFIAFASFYRVERLLEWRPLARLRKRLGGSGRDRQGVESLDSG